MTFEPFRKKSKYPFSPNYVLYEICQKQKALLIAIEASITLTFKSSTQGLRSFRTSSLVPTVFMAFVTKWHPQFQIPNTSTDAIV